MVKVGKARTLEDVTSLLGAVAVTVLAVIIVSVLYLGREIFVPVALAILLSFVLAAPVSQLQRLRVPRGIAVVGVVLFAFVVIFALGSLIASQLNRLAGELPQYQSTIQGKIQSVRGVAGGSSTLERAEGMLQDLSKELNKPKNGASPKAANPVAAGGRSVTPVTVEVLQPDPGTLESLRSLIAPLVSPLATTGIIVIFVIFILIQREDLRNRLIRLAGSHDLQRTTAALDDAAGRLSRLFLNQLLINTGFGVLIGVGLWIIGIPSAVLWGILAAVLRFVPYIGSIIAAAFPLVLAVAVDPSWTMLAWTAVLFFVIEPAIGQVVEPMVYGRSTGLSPVAVVVSATFWTALWGPIGLVLATPLTVCLVVLGRHVERLAFLDVMFGDRPALSPPEIFYQRMLAGDPTEAAEKAEEFLKERSLSSYYDEVALPGLRLAQADLDREVLDVARLVKIRDAVSEFAADLSDPVENTGKHETVDPGSCGGPGWCTCASRIAHREPRRTFRAVAERARRSLHCGANSPGRGRRLDVHGSGPSPRVGRPHRGSRNFGDREHLSDGDRRRRVGLSLLPRHKQSRTYALYRPPYPAKTTNGDNNAGGLERRYRRRKSRTTARKCEGRPRLPVTS
jgi:predicted PurR-regulated permease PerM